MRTGFTKKQRITVISFDEYSRIIRPECTTPILKVTDSICGKASVILPPDQ